MPVPVENITGAEERRATVAFIRRAIKGLPDGAEGDFLDGALGKLAEFIEEGKHHEKVDAS